MTALGHSLGHSCEHCQQMVLDFSIDGGYLGPSRLDLISRLIGTPDVRLNYEPHRLLHEFTLFGMTLDDLKQGADAGCLLCALMMEEGNYWGNIESIYDCTPSTPAFAARLSAGDRLTFGILKMNLNDEGELNHDYWELFDFVFQILAGSGTHRVFLFKSKALTSLYVFGLGRLCELLT